jgi:hypothetical protein
MKGRSFEHRDRSRRYGRVSSLIRVDTLAARSAMLVGLGSMGLPVANQLVRHGVASRPPGRLHLVDGDVVDERNLIGTDYRFEHLGRAKVLAARGILTEINHAVAVSVWDRTVREPDLPRLVDIAGQVNLVGLFADSFDLMVDLADRCAGLCPVVMAVFGPNADYAEVAFSVPRETAPIRRLVGQRERTRIESPSALGCDTAFVAQFVAAVCLELLLDPADRGTVIPLHYEAPLMIIGVRKRWIFEDQPADVARMAVYVQTSP